MPATPRLLFLPVFMVLFSVQAACAPKVSLEPVNLDDADLQRLSQVFPPVDEPMLTLQRFLALQSDPPTREWTERLFGKFPWISGMAVLDLEGRVLTRKPEESLKKLNFAPLLNVGDEWYKNDLRGHVESTSLGPEMYLGTGLYQDHLLKGVLVVHYDPRVLVRRSPNPDQLVVLTPETMIWPGKAPETSKALLTAPWEDILADDVQGKWTTPEAEFTWVARYIGGEWLIYAVTDRG
jgi:hypothetical protein